MEGDCAGPWSLPDGLLLHALLTLPLKEFLACARVCKRWHRLSESLHSQAVYPLIDRRLAKIGAKAAAPAAPAPPHRAWNLGTVLASCP